jgi:hypothetical protein
MANTIRIYRSKQSEALDARFSGSPEQLRTVYETALQLYDRYPDVKEMVGDLASTPELPWNGDTVTEFETDRWSTGRDAVLKHAYKEAVELALAHEPPVPLETFWVTGAGDEFELQISDGFDRVTVFMIVPPDKDVMNSSARAANKAWVVTAGGRTSDEGRPVSELPGGISKIEVSGKPD